MKALHCSCLPLEGKVAAQAVGWLRGLRSQREKKQTEKQEGQERLTAARYIRAVGGNWYSPLTEDAPDLLAVLSHRESTRLFLASP